ncbi:phage portal protein [Pandoraea cepalis]|uniref:Phage portal protein n=1 Tax=Pandoraea cepalis TaxID=2508294 RepID=A0AAW7MJ65_9BURK|nr:phage portal protein [Pandoraea cepalis]MDN4572663.1 phage portal protein [Pandoraea cepalis]MDN4577078.1 phage portal protein [Pandoraea cepalis]
MSKKQRFQHRQPAATPAAAPAVSTAAKAEAFTFGDPVAVLDRREILSYVECMRMGKWYEPPLSWDGLGRSFLSAPHHSSAIFVKRNILSLTFMPHPLLSRAEFEKFALNFLIFGNAYFERRRNRFGGTVALKAALTKYVRRGLELDRYWWVPEVGQETQFEVGDVFHLMEPDLHQEVYGLPEYLAALNSAWLNESATLFRRRYYKNGSHAGFILYMTDAAHEQKDVDAMREAIRSAKGPGNFRNLFMYAPNGKKDGIQLLPVSEVAAKDEFFNIKNVTRDDLLAAHRVPPQLMSVLPNNTGGFGDVTKAARVFGINEVQPLQERMKAVNEWIGEEVMRFGPYALAETDA